MRLPTSRRIESQAVAMTPDEHKSLVEVLTAAGTPINLGILRVSIVLDGPPTIAAPEDAHLD